MASAVAPLLDLLLVAPLLDLLLGLPHRRPTHGEDRSVSEDPCEAVTASSSSITKAFAHSAFYSTAYSPTKKAGRSTTMPASWTSPCCPPANQKARKSAKSPCQMSITSYFLPASKLASASAEYTAFAGIPRCLSPAN